MLLLLSLKICSESFLSEKGLELFTIQFHSILVNYILRNQHKAAPLLSGDNSGILFLIYYVTTHAFIQKKLQNWRTLGDDKLGWKVS